MSSERHNSAREQRPRDETTPAPDAVEVVSVRQAAHDLECHTEPLREALTRLTGRADFTAESDLAELRRLRRETRGVTAHSFTQGTFTSPEGIPYVVRVVRPSYWSPYLTAHIRLGECCGVEVVTAGVSAADLALYATRTDPAVLRTLHRCALDPRVTAWTRWVRRLQ